MGDVEKLYWLTVADLCQDDYGIWEIAWAANTLSGSVGEVPRRTAATVIGRLMVEGLVCAFEESGDICPPSRLAEILVGADWARAVDPQPKIVLHGLELLDLREREMPKEAVDAITALALAPLAPIPDDIEPIG